MTVENALVRITTSTSSGSGFIVTDDGLIVTSAHVVGQDLSVIVRVVNDRASSLALGHRGWVLGRDETTDLAVIKIYSRLPFQPMELGNANSIHEGDEVIALGFPLGNVFRQDYMVTGGIVSSRRTYDGVEMLQTDGAIDPSNSGGPLLNINGQVIGVNTSKLTEHQGISFAVSIAEVRKKVDFSASGGDWESRVLFKQASIVEDSLVQRREASHLFNHEVNPDLKESQKNIDHFQQELDIRRKDGDRHSESTFLFYIGGQYLQIKAYHLAIHYFQQELDIYRELGGYLRNREAGALGRIAQSYDKLGEYHEAIDFLQRALPIHQEMRNCEGEAKSLFRIGVSYRKLGEYREALDSFQQARDVFRRGEYGSGRGIGEIDCHASEARSLNNIGVSYNDLERYREALNSFQQALPIYREIGDREGEAKCLNNIGVSYDKLKEYREARDFHQQKLAIYRELSRANEGRADASKNDEDALNSIGISNEKLEVSLDGERLIVSTYLDNIAAWQEIGGHRDFGAHLLYQTGISYHKLEEYPDALHYYQQALAIFQEISDRAHEVITLQRIGVIYFRLKDYREALNSFQQALAIFQEVGLGHRDSQARSLFNIGVSYEKLEDCPEALDFLRQALAIYRELGRRPEYEAASLFRIGLSYNNLGEEDKALNSLQQALAIYQKIGDQEAEAEVLKEINDLEGHL